MLAHLLKYDSAQGRYALADKVEAGENSITVDGKLKAQTGVMKANTAKERLVVDVRNSSEIKLVVDVATNGNNWDHANWADARFRNVPQFYFDYKQIEVYHLHFEFYILMLSYRLSYLLKHYKEFLFLFL